jgi:uncharacterized protein
VPDLSKRLPAEQTERWASEENEDEDEHERLTNDERAHGGEAGMTSGTDRPATSHFVELTAQECQDRLASRTTGRVGWSSPEGQNILPVTYTLHAGTVVFRTLPDGALSHLARGSAVAFEVDEINEGTGDAWSVVVQGWAEAVSPPHDLASLLATPAVLPWAPGFRNVLIAITPQHISGRSVRAPFAD